MMKYEFEQLAGYEVTTEDYNNIIEPMYMATYLTKEEFVKTLNRKQFAVKVEKSQEQIELENNLKEEIKLNKLEIKEYTECIKTMKMYVEISEHEDDINCFKESIKTYRRMIKQAKQRIQQIKFILN